MWTWIELVRLVHACLGAVALVSMVGPMVTVKGGGAHRRWGTAFVAAMAGTVLLAWVASAIRLYEGAGPYGPLFLSLVGLLAGACTWGGWRVRAEKGRVRAHTDLLDRGVMGSLAAAGAAALGFGLWSFDPLFGAFGALCLRTGWSELTAMALVEPERWHWWYRHMVLMLAACIGTTTAFLVVNVSNLPAEVRGVMPAWMWWLLPTAIGTPGIFWWTGQWRRWHAERTTS
jgi:uncharacterized membrane protein